MDFRKAAFKMLDEMSGIETNVDVPVVSEKKTNDIDLVLEGLDVELENVKVSVVEENEEPQKDLKEDFRPRFLGKLNESPNPQEYKDGTMYKDTRSGTVYIVENGLWESLVEDGKPGSQGRQGSAGSGTGVKEVENIVQQSLESLDITKMSLRNFRKSVCLQQFTCVGVGDSLTEGSNNSGSYYDYLCRQYGSIFSSLDNLGVGGAFVSAIDNQIDPAIALNPDIIFLCAGGNNATTDLLSSAANSPIKMYESWIVKILNNNIIPILVTLPPSVTLGKIQSQSIFNGLIHYFGMKYNVPVFDFWDSVRNITNGNWTSGASLDGTHPTWLTVKNCVDLVLPKFLNGTSNTFPINYNPLTSAQDITNPFFSVDSNVDGVADNWTIIGTNTSASIVSGSDILGNWQKLAYISTSGGISITGPNIPTSSYSTGDTVVVCAICKSDKIINRYSTNYMNFGGTIKYIGERGSTSQVTWANISQTWVAYSKFVVPNNSAVKWTLSLTGQISGGDLGTGEIYINRPQFINLTRLGVE